MPSPVVGDNNAQSSGSSKRKGLRSSIACTRCNISKCKCDVASRGSPCSRCKKRNYSDCTPIQSRRGTYERKTSHNRQLSSVLNPSEILDSSSANADISTFPDTSTFAKSSSSLPIVSNCTISPDQAIEGTKAQLSLRSSASPPLPTVAETTTLDNPPLEGSGQDDMDLIELTEQLDAEEVINFINRPSYEMVLTRELSTSPDAWVNPSLVSTIGSGTIKSLLNHAMQSYDAQQSKEWSIYFKSFFDNVAATAGKRTILYFGESFPVSWLLQHLQKIKGQIRIERPRITEVHVPPGKHPPDVEEAKIAYLSSQGCFIKPPPEVVHQLFATYFETVHNVYPILNRNDFMNQYKANHVPWLLFHSILFAASSYCRISLLCSDGLYRTRREARMNFYRRAKSLFDLSYEKNKIALIQSALLLSFWGGSPDDYWNSISWINMAVNIAESLGMHRSTSTLDIAVDERALWRRIWWCLVARDSFCASLQGKPLRINLSQCDVEPLSLADFDSDCNPPGTDIWGTRCIEHALYVIENCKLSLILRTIVQARDTRYIDTEFVLHMHKELQDWVHQMPDQLKVHLVSPESPAYVFCAALSLVYNHHLIYLHQTAPPECEISLPVAKEAVSNIAEFGSTLVTLSVIPFIPQDSLASFFMAIVMLFTQMQDEKSEDRMGLLRMQLNVCEMIVHQSQDHWDHADWILAISESLRQKLDSGSDKQESNNLPTKMLTACGSRSDDLNVTSGSNIIGPKTSTCDMGMDESAQGHDLPNYLAISTEGETSLQGLNVWSLLEGYSSAVGT
ncbi:fungal-specific transcription factor domain-containing protein [Lipomyces orientalis]|uniref:Fungal-specific transcription factor domain-containing protein n=1 Tax=Lipomyces orientalis TaxID=1233043 RepID=A0ACC3TK51_9ASCO